MNPISQLHHPRRLLTFCGCLVLLFLCGCGYSWKQAVVDSTDPRPTKRRKSLEYFVNYITEKLNAPAPKLVERRREAIVAVGDTGLPKAVNTLRMVLMHEKVPSLRTEAIRSLAKLKDPSALRELQGALKDRDIKVRMVAAAALGKIGDQRALGSLFRALKDPQPVVRASAVSALADLKATIAIPLLIKALNDSSPQVQRASQKSLLRLGEPAIPALLETLKRGRQEKRRSSAKMLALFGEPAFAPLVKFFLNKPLRPYTVLALGDLTKDRMSWPLLGKILDAPETDDPNQKIHIQSTTVQQLRNVGTLATLKAILVLWNRIPVHVRKNCRYLLGEIAHRYNDRGRAILSKAAKEGNDLSRRSTAIFALGHAGVYAHPLLKPFLRSKERVLVLSTIRALGFVGKVAIPDLLPFLVSSDEELRVTAIRSSAELQDPRVVAKLLEQLKHPSAKIREAGLEALAKQKDRSVIPSVRKLLKDPINNVMMAAIQTLIRLGDRQNIKIYILALKQGPYPPAPGYVKTLGMLGDKQIVPLLKNLMLRYLKDWKRYVKKAKRAKARLEKNMPPNQAVIATRKALAQHPARQPNAVCSFIEAMRGLVDQRIPVYDIMGKAGYLHSETFNPLRFAPSSCPWPGAQGKPQ